MVFVPPERFNISDHFLTSRVREGHGGRVALRVDSEDGSTREWTYGQVEALADRFAHVLSQLGLEPEQRVIVALPDSAEFVGAFFGTLKAGGVVVMVNPRLPAAQLAALFEYSRAKVAVIDGAAPEAFLEAAEAGAWPRQILTVGGACAESDRVTAWENLSEGLLAEPFPIADTHCDEPAIWLFSGGTTGRPKAVVQSHRSFANTTEHYAKKALGYRAEDVTLSVPKLFFGYATGSNLLFPFSVGATAVLFPEHPTADLLFEKVRKHRPTILINVPTMINHMVTHEAAGEADLSCLRCCTSAGEALPVPLHERWNELFAVDLLDGLGTAEMWHVFLTNLPGATKPGTLGKVIDGFEIDVRDAEGRSLGPDEVGQLWVRGDSRAQCYWQEAEKSTQAFRGEWFVGGDLVSRDAEGWVTYQGRGDDVLKVGGKWLVPGEVESCLLRHAQVEECAVVGVTDANGLTKPHAFVIAKESSDALAEELQQCVIDELAPYKYPRQIHFVDDFPRTHLGKVDRGKLKAGGILSPLDKVEVSDKALDAVDDVIRDRGRWKAKAPKL